MDSTRITNSAPAKHRTVTTPAGRTYADVMAAPSTSTSMSKAFSQAMGPSQIPLRTSEKTAKKTASTITEPYIDDFPTSKPTVKLPFTQPPSTPWEDMKGDEPITELSFPPCATKPSTLPPWAPKPATKSLETRHATAASPAPPKKTSSAAKSESVLFSPAEKKFTGKNYGGWSNLKGDPKKLERLNNPYATPLESRWAC